MPGSLARVADPSLPAPPMRLLCVLTAGCLTLAAGACRDVVAPEGAAVSSEVTLASGLRLGVEVAPAGVAPGDSLVIRVLVRNPTAAPVSVTSGCSTLAVLGLARADGGASRLPAGFGCFAVVTPFTLAAGETVVYEDRTAARAYDGGSAAPGVYVAQAYSNLPGDRRQGPGDEALPNAEARFTVR